MILQLIFSFFQVGLFSIGGGYAAMPIIQSQVVDTYGWLTLNEFANLVTIAEMTPGPIAINAATFVGTRLAGPLGAVCATLSCITPSLVIVTILSVLYKRYGQSRGMQTVLGCLRPIVVALIASAAIDLARAAAFESGVVALDGINAANVILFAASLLMLRVKKWNPILVMGCCGLIGLLLKVSGIWA